MTLEETPNPATDNPLLDLAYEPFLENLGDDYYDIVTAADFPLHRLRFRNDDLLAKIGLNPATVRDDDLIEAFGQFRGVRPFLALRYHGYQFGEYNPQLGDGRGFIYGQLRGTDGKLYDLGTKGSGRTPYSRTADGRLTLKGGVREVLAGEMLHRMGVRTSRCLTVIETGEQLWRGDEPSPTRSCVMVRLSESHIRFGTFERLHYLGRKDLIAKLLDRAIAQYYPEVDRANADPVVPFAPGDRPSSTEKYILFYAELVKRVAKLAAQWMAAGFCHAVLNTDNMAITGESFDYGPYAFIPRYDPQFTAAYFDYFGRYSYGNQAPICRWNLQMLQVPLRAIADSQEMDAALEPFYDYYNREYRRLMLAKLGFAEGFPEEAGTELVKTTIALLQQTDVGYHEFFWQIRKQFDRHWWDDVTQILPNFSDEEIVTHWRHCYYHLLQFISVDELEMMTECLARYNPETVIVRPEIEAVWEPIALHDNWDPFCHLLKRIKR
jgi:uncharacterized protein YdiU (UPF0061 family)